MSWKAVTDPAMMMLLIVQRSMGEALNASRKLASELLVGIQSGGRLITAVSGFNAVITFQYRGKRLTTAKAVATMEAMMNP